MSLVSSVTRNDAAVAAAPGVVAREHPLYAKFFKMLKAGVPRGAVKQRMQVEGLDAAALNDPDAVIIFPERNAAAMHLPLSLSVIASADSEVAIAAKYHPKYAKFFKMLNAGVARGAVEQRMQVEGLAAAALNNPDVMMPTGSQGLLSSLPSLDATRMIAVKDHSNYGKYLKMLSVGTPQGAVQQIMQLRGLDATMLQTPDVMIPMDTESPLFSPAAVPGGRSTVVAAMDHPDYVKFFNMLKVGTPRGAVEQRMEIEGFDKTILQAPEVMIPINRSQSSLMFPASAAGQYVKEKVSVKIHPEYAKFFKMLNVGVPYGAVKLLMEHEQKDVAVLDTPDSLMSIASDGMQHAPPRMAVKDHLEYVKYFKMLQVGVSKGAVEQLMKVEGLQAGALNTPDVIIPVIKIDVQSTPRMAVKDHPEYAKYVKMLRVGVPVGAVKQRMESKGLDSAYLDAPDVMVPLSAATLLKVAHVVATSQPGYSKYFKMLEIGVPKGGVQQLMQVEGGNADVLDNPNKEVPLVDVIAPPRSMAADVQAPSMAAAAWPQYSPPTRISA